MIDRLLTSIHSRLKLIARCPGRESKDRVILTDLARQVEHMQRRYARREADMQRSTMSRSGQ